MQDLNDKITGGTLIASEWNELPSEIQNVIEALGITLSEADLNQLGKAIAGYVANGNFYTDSGIANSYVLSVIGSKQRLPSYTNGATFEFITSNANTGASTVNVAGLGVKNIKLPGGSDPSAGQISGRTVVKYDSSNDWMELYRSGQVKITRITSNQVFTPTPRVKSIKFTVIGGGGGGGGVQGTGTGSALGGGGASGASVVHFTSLIDASYTINIGAGGAGGAGTGGNAGTVGAHTTLNSTNVSIIAQGGGPGAGMVSSTGDVIPGGSVSGTGTGGNMINSNGGEGGRPILVGGVRASLGWGGASILGGSIRGRSEGVGFDATTEGGGGGGAGIGTSVGANDGGDGADGIVIIEEFF